MAHIWACPPSEGDDYIFHCHPPEQKIPKPKRLQEWYKKMLDKGIIERIILDYKDILKQAMEDNISSAAELPYFEGDFWPNVLEESIKELDQEEEEKRKQAEAAEAVVSIFLTCSLYLFNNIFLTCSSSMYAIEPVYEIIIIKQKHMNPPKLCHFRGAKYCSSLNMNCF